MEAHLKEMKELTDKLSSVGALIPEEEIKRKASVVVDAPYIIYKSTRCCTSGRPKER